MKNKKFIITSIVLILFLVTSIKSIQAEQSQEKSKLEKVTVGPVYVNTEKIPEVNRNIALLEAERVMKNFNVIPGVDCQ